jgi:hypothetical protein
MLRCPAHDMNQVPWNEDAGQAKEATCIQCRWHAAQYRGMGVDRAVSWDRYLSPAPVAGLAAKLSGKQWEKFQWQGIRFGELATAATRMLLKQEPGKKASPEYRKYWSMTCRASIQAYEGMKRLSEAWKPDFLLHYDQYPVLISARIAAQRRGISVLTVGHALLNGIDRGKVQFFESTYNKMIQRLAARWPRYRRQALSWEQASVSLEDLISRMQGGHTHVYSQPMGQNENLHAYRDLLAKEKKILLVFTSSEDEVGAEIAISRALDIREKMVAPPFSNQAEWLAWLRGYADQSGHHVVVRVHPREGGSNRNPRISENLGRLKKLLGRDRENFSVVWPDSPISSYDLLHIAHAVTVSYSSIGLEAARSGIPVVTAFGPPVYEHPSLAMMLRAPSRGEYRKVLDAWMGSPLFLDPGAWTDVFHWHYLITAGSSFELDAARQLKTSEIFRRTTPGAIPEKMAGTGAAARETADRIARRLSEFFASRTDEKSARESALLKRLRCRNSFYD